MAPLDQQVYKTSAQEPKHLDHGADIYNGFNGELIWEGLYRNDWVTGQPIPTMAKSYKVSEDAKTWTFTLWNDFKWTDGKPVTAHDYEYAIKRNVDPNIPNVYANFMYLIKGARDFNQKKPGATRDQVGVKALDDYTLEIQLEKPVGYFLLVAGFPTFRPVRQDLYEKYGLQWTEPEHIVTNGPYKLVEWKHQQRIVVERNNDYPWARMPWKGKIQRVEYSLTVGNGLLAYENNEIYETDVAAGDIAHVRGDPVLSKEFTLYPADGTFWIGFKTQKPPFNNLKLRQALALAIDKETLAKVIKQGTYIPADTMLAPRIPGFHPGDSFQSNYKGDIPKAKQLFAEALKELGLSDAGGLGQQEILVNNNREIDAAQYIQSQWRDNLGFNVGVRSLESGVFRDLLKKNDMNIYLNTWHADFLDPYNFLNEVWSATGKESTLSDWRNADFEKIVAAAAIESDQPKRQQMYHDADKILAEDVGGIFIFWDNRLKLYKSFLGGIRSAPDGSFKVPHILDMYIKKH